MENSTIEATARNSDWRPINPAAPSQRTIAVRRSRWFLGRNHAVGTDTRPRLVSGVRRPAAMIGLLADHRRYPFDWTPIQTEAVRARASAWRRARKRR